MAPVTLLVASILVVLGLVSSAPLFDEMQNGLAKNIIIAGRPTATKYWRSAKRGVMGVRTKREISENPEDVERQLSELSDDELKALAKMMQYELDNYEPRLKLDGYQVIEIPNDTFLDEADDDNDNEINEAYEAVGLPENALFMKPVKPDVESSFAETNINDGYFEPEAIIVPNVVMDELNDRLLNDLELRIRIAKLADALSERAIRGL